MDKTIYAHTGCEYKSYPAFVNLSEKEDGSFVLMVRAKEASDVSSIELSASVLIKLRDSLCNMELNDG